MKERLYKWIFLLLFCVCNLKTMENSQDEGTHSQKKAHCANEKRSTEFNGVAATFHVIPS